MYRSDVKFYRNLYHDERDSVSTFWIKIMDMHSHHNRYVIDEIHKIKESNQALKRNGDKAPPSA